MSITLSIPEEIKRKMEKYPEVNWSGYVRSAIEQKVAGLEWKERTLSKLREEADYTGWTVEYGRKVKKEAYKKLKKREGL